MLHLLSYLQSTLLHPAHAGWLERLGGVVERFYVEDKRRAVRLRALKVLSEVTLANLVLHEERLLEACVLPHLANLEEETDRKVRVEAVELVARLVASLLSYSPSSASCDRYSRCLSARS